MTLSPEDKKNLSNLRMEKAWEFIGDAETTYKQQMYKTSVNRSYYAALSAMRALLILEGINPQSHDGILTLLSLRFIKTNMLPYDTAKKFKILFSKRTDVDYGDFEKIEKQDAEESLTLAKYLLSTIDPVRKGIIENT